MLSILNEKLSHNRASISKYGFLFVSLLGEISCKWKFENCLKVW